MEWGTPVGLGHVVTSPYETTSPGHPRSSADRVSRRRLPACGTPGAIASV